MNRERDVYGDRYDIYVEELKKMGVAYLPDTSWMFIRTSVSGVIWRCGL